MQNYSIGLLNCAITKRFDRCVHVLLGQINTDDQGAIDLWSNLSATALQSLRDDLLNPYGRGHGCEIGMGECCVTWNQATCIRALVAILPELINREPTGREVLIYACLSLEGIDHLLKCLEQEVVLLDLGVLAENTKQTPYMWTVTHGDVEIVSQYTEGQAERTFNDVRLPEVDMLLVEPRDLLSGLPAYRLDDESFKMFVSGKPAETLPLPVPDEPFAFVYYRRVTCTVLCSGGTGASMPPRIVQVLGWRIERPAGDLICELGVEEDGSWTIYRRGRLSGDEYMLLLEDEFLQAMEERQDR